MNEAQRNAALQEVKALRKAAADLAGRAQSLEQLLTAAPETAAAIPDYAIGQSPPPESLADWIQAGKDTVDWSSLTGQDLPAAVLQGRQAERLLAEVIRVYSAFPEVRGIAVGQYLHEVRVFALVEMGEQYDMELVGRLLKKERELRQQFKPLCLCPDYVAIGDEDLCQSRYNVGDIIWRRDTAADE